nr:TetR/AcrR family transcriptional regulator [Pseudooceanicola sp. HF7]
MCGDSVTENQRSDQDGGEPRSGCCEGRGKPGRPVVYSADERRRIILDVLDKRFGSGGVQMLTISAIARESGMSRRTLYELFEDRDGLLMAYMERLVDQCLQPLAPEQHALPLEDRLRLLLARRRKPNWDMPLAILRHAVVSGPDSPEFGRRCLEIGPRRWESLICMELDRSVSREELPADFDSRAAAELLRDMIQIPVLDPMLDDTFRPDEATINARMNLGLKVFLSGIGLQPGKNAPES